MIAASLEVLEAVAEVFSIRFDLTSGGAIGLPAITEDGRPLTDQVVAFCDGVFRRGGAVLAGAGGDRFVYDLRRRYNLFCKLNPLRPLAPLHGCGVIKPQVTANVDIMVVRDNLGGVYQGEWAEETSTKGRRKATHAFSYDEAQVMRLLRAAAAMARRRRGLLTLALKPNGVPTVSQLWIDCAEPLAREFGVALKVLEIDFAVYQLIQSPGAFDVIATPNLFGDILADLGGVLLGSRGLCFGASYAADGTAVYQTNHGAAYDLAGSDRANPIAQILSLSMLLRESFGLTDAAAQIDAAVCDVLRQGYRTIDIIDTGRKIIGTRKMAELIAASIRRKGAGAC
jgi:3-isopropylmalate dehydrogenase